MATEAALNLLRRNIESPESARALEEWLCKSLPDDVDATYQQYFNQLCEADEAANPSDGIKRAKDAAWNLMSSLTSGRGASAEGPTPIALALVPHPPTFNLVRLQTHVIAFSQAHVAGPRGLPPGAAGRPPGRVAMLPGAGQAGQGAKAGAGGTARTQRAPPVQHLPGSPAVLQPCPIHTPLECALTLRNVGRRKAVVAVRPLQSLLDGGYLTVDPPSLALARGETGTVAIGLRLLHPGREVKGLLMVETEGGVRQVALVRAMTEVTVFGVHLADVPVAPSRSLIGGYSGLPLPLLQLESRLCLDDCAAMCEEGIFRVSPSEAEKDAIRKQLDAGTFHGGAARAASGIATATMVKVFLRELPTPLFSPIPKEQLLVAQDDEGTVRAVGWISGQERLILEWLVALLVEVAGHEPSNKMTLKALAICTGPNLFLTDESVNPMEALMVSQKAVALLLRLVTMAQQGQWPEGRTGQENEQAQRKGDPVAAGRGEVVGPARAAVHSTGVGIAPARTSVRSGQPVPLQTSPTEQGNSAAL